MSIGMPLSTFAHPSNAHQCRYLSPPFCGPYAPPTPLTLREAVPSKFPCLCADWPSSRHPLTGLPLLNLPHPRDLPHDQAAYLDGRREASSAILRPGAPSPIRVRLNPRHACSPFPFLVSFPANRTAERECGVGGTYSAGNIRLGTCSQTPSCTHTSSRQLYRGSNNTFRKNKTTD